MKNLLVVLAAGGSLSISCREVLDPEIRAASPVGEIVDGNTGGGHPGFYFIPPVVEDLAEPIGPFDPTFLPYLRVDVCVLAGGDCESGPVTIFTSNQISGVRPVFLSSEHIHIGRKKAFQFYRANWFTDQFDVDPLRKYRAHVLVSPAGGVPRTELGHVDVDPVKTWKELREVNREEFVGVLDDRLLPIVFRIDGNTTIQFKEYLNYCTTADVVACASVRIRTLAVEPGDPRARFPDTRTIIGFDVRNLQGAHSADNTGGSLIGGLAIRAPTAPLGRSIRSATVDVAGGYAADGDVGEYVQPGLFNCFDEEGNVLWGCAGVPWAVEPVVLTDADGIALFPDWSEIPSGGIRGCDAIPVRAGFALITCDRLNFDGWAVFQIFEANYALSAGALELDVVGFTTSDPFRSAACEPDVNCEPTPNDY